jgi:Uma2 family endonuclease
MDVTFAPELTRNNHETEYILERGKPMPSLNHFVLETQIAGLLKFKYRQYTVGSELSLELPFGKATPDVAVLEKQKIDWNRDIVKFKEAPLLVVEILSPKQNLDEIKDKIFDIYQPSGVISSWIVVPPFKTVTVYSQDGSIKTYTEGVIKVPELGIELTLEEIFDV